MARERLNVPAQLRDGTRVNVWYEAGCLQTDYDEGELNGEPIFDLNGEEMPDFIPQNERTRNRSQAFWASVKVVRGKDAGNPWS